ncbi:alpha-hydroxy-acid oxidizing protein [Streptomyces coeruleoprunus]|uniref:alpha-hydroxy-acid oxidizing protein n=1 Tax=Streptomyces coeruleoprunus TaxID=285563 RepID=UPI0031F0E54C
MMRSGTATAPAGTLTLADYAALARRRMPADAWALLEGGPDEERSLRANRAAFDRVRLRPRVLAGLDRHLLPETETRILGRTWAAPVAVAALGRHTLAHPDGEVATAAAAAAAGVPFVVSSLSGRTLEDIAAAATGGLWLQLHSFHDRLTIRRLVRRAESAGFEALVLTSEAPRPGGRGPGTAGPVVDPALLTWLRSVTPLPLLVHGVLTADEARLAVDAGANGIVVSNHAGRPAGSDRTRRRATTGGRATDDEGRRTGDGGHPPGTAALDALPEIAAAVGGACPVLLDGGVRRGGDVLAALALGADAVLLGRPVLHGLAVGRGEGVTDVLDILIDELTDAMTLTGIGSVADADPGLVSGSAGEGAARPAHTTRLLKEELHASVSDPVLDTMNFLNEITHRYPEAISFAPGRPYDGFFDTGELLDHIRRYLDHLADSGHSPARIRDPCSSTGRPPAGSVS